MYVAASSASQFPTERISAMVLSAYQVAWISAQLEITGYMTVVITETNLSGTVAVKLDGKTTLVNHHGDTFTL
jgi:hypothetical protein